MEKRSLSWYKKRVAALNKALGSKYSPTEIYRAEQVKGYDTDIGRALEALGDPRGKGSEANISAGAVILIKEQWPALAANNVYVYAVSNSVGGYISQDGTTTYTQDARGNWYQTDIRSGDTVQIDGEPTGAIRLTPATANKLLQAKAQELKPFKNRKGESINNYLYE